MFKRKTIIAVVILFIIAVYSFAGFARTKYVVPILMYHSINQKVNPGMRLLIVSPKAFERQMRFLKEHKYNAIPLEEMVSLVKNKKKIPPRTLIITFDDGYKDNYSYAFRTLKKYKIPATIFIITGEVGRPDRLSWEEIKEMQGSRLISFGSHTLSSTPLIDIKPDEEIKRQIFESKKILEEKLGQPVTTFSYPQGRFNAKIKQLVKDAGYSLAVGTFPGKRFANDDLFLLKRLRISENAGNLFVFGFEISGYYTFLKEWRTDK